MGYRAKKTHGRAMEWHTKNLKCKLLRERKQSEKATCFIIQFLWHSEKGKTIEIVNDQWLSVFPWQGEVWCLGQTREF